MRQSFRHITPPSRIYFGEDSLQQLPVELDRMGCRRAVIFCGNTLAGHPRGLPFVAAALGNRFAGAFNDVRTHSPLPQVLAGAETLRQLNADAVVALGGGSAVVTARASAILFAEGQDIHALCTQHAPGKSPVSPRLAQIKLPQFVVATTPTTAYAKAGSAVLDPDQGRRLALFDPKTRAAAVFFHPEIALTASPQLVLGSALQAFATAVQGIESSVGDPLADGLLIHALRLLGHHLPMLMIDPEDPEIRGQLMLGALMAGQGSDYAPSGLASAIAHCIGARFERENGVTTGIVLPHTMRFNAPVTGQRLALVTDALGAHKADSTEAAVAGAIQATEELCSKLGIPKRLREINVPKDALLHLAKDIADDWFLHQNPRRINSTVELLQILENAW